ncbi:MAG: autotransporter outer membrane beta-barrel domain-containing protein, partial [Rickettsiales bacterium]|nr:autotransporter outer membrane beta-barrel domain-containing protein [Rickettsiales bacterium]
FGSFGSQKLEEDAETSGYGFVLGFDRKITKSIKLGLAAGFSGGEAKSDLRTRTDDVWSISLYGDYSSERFPIISAILTYGFLSTKDNKLSGDGSILYISPKIGYKFHLREEKDQRMDIIPELGLRFSMVQQGKQSSSYDSISATSRNILSIVPALRFTGFFREKYELGAKLGLSYDLSNGGDSSYTVTLQNEQSYQIVDESDKNAKMAVEIGLNLGYRLSNSIRISSGYSGKYASDLTNHTISFEGSFRF